MPYKAAHDIAVANVKSAEAVLSTARLVLESNKGLLEEEVVSEFDLQTARNEVMEAEAVLQSSRLAFLPFVSLGGQGQVSHSDGRPAQRTYSVGPSAEWELDIFGRQRNAKAGAKAALGQSRAYEQAMQTRLVATVADSYYTLLMLDEQLQISRRTLTTWQENIRTLSALKRAGKTTEAAVLQARANKLEVEGSILTLEKRIGELENTVCALLGIAPVKLERGVLADQHFPDSLSAGLPLSLVGNRPDVREAEFALMQSFYATGEARSAFYPRITLSGTIGWTNHAGTISNPGTWLFNAVGSLVQPLFHKGENVARLKIARAKQQEALLQFRQSLLDAGNEVNNALILWQTARKRILNLKAAVWNTKLLMKYGRTHYLEVLTAQQKLLQAELAESEDRYDEIQGVITLYHALGGGTK
ncbi:TolC family protein [uncultured Alistipes sp.]|uniref:TolC family protein n=1 Tax=uncultured Alistipes sp. TaxID=538949 RepID=UPI002633541B|nr:TolC family protein [uncultured Alistipes sp.]